MYEAPARILETLIVSPLTCRFLQIDSRPMHYLATGCGCRTRTIGSAVSDFPRKQTNKQLQLILRQRTSSSRSIVGANLLRLLFKREASPEGRARMRIRGSPATGTAPELSGSGWNAVRTTPRAEAHRAFRLWCADSSCADTQ